MLVADDDRELLELVGRAMRRIGLDVSLASSGGELLEQIAEHGPFDLVVTDVSMPWMTGLQVMHSARTAGMVCPAVVMTALRDHVTRQQIKALGLDVRLVQKPFGIAELESAVRAGLGIDVTVASPRRSGS